MKTELLERTTNAATSTLEPAIYTLTVTCVWGMYLESECLRVLEMREDQTLMDLHDAIQKAIHFDNDHPHEFYAARTERSRPRFSLTDLEGNAEYTPATIQLFRNFGRPPAPVPPKIAAAAEWAIRLSQIEDPPLNQIFPLPERLKLFYWFDFGDDWKFEIKKERRTHPPRHKTKYPRVVRRVGPNPKQYPNWG